MSHRDCKPATRERSWRFADSGAGRPKHRPGGLVLHRFTNGLLRCVRSAACITNLLGVAVDCRIGMPVGLDLASRHFLWQIALNFFWCSPFIMCAVIPWVLRVVVSHAPLLSPGQSRPPLPSFLAESTPILHVSPWVSPQVDFPHHPIRFPLLT